MKGLLFWFFLWFTFSLICFKINQIVCFEGSKVTERNALLQPKKKKNISQDTLGTQHGRVHMQSQDLTKLQTRKMKGLKQKSADSSKETEAQPSGPSMELVTSGSQPESTSMEPARKRQKPSRDWNYNLNCVSVSMWTFVNNFVWIKIYFIKNVCDSFLLYFDHVLLLE